MVINTSSYKTSFICNIAAEVGRIDRHNVNLDIQGYHS